MTINRIERIRPCKCGHSGDNHWHKWTETNSLVGEICTIGDFQCHFIFGCECFAYKDMGNLHYLGWLNDNKKWPRKWFTWLL